MDCKHDQPSNLRDVDSVPFEKETAMHHEDSRNISQDDVEFLANFSHERRKKVIRKVDVSSGSPAKAFLT